MIATSDFNVYLIDEENFNIARQFVGYNDEIFDASFVGSKRTHIAVAANSPELRLYNMNSWSCCLVDGKYQLNPSQFCN